MTDEPQETHFDPEAERRARESHGQLDLRIGIPLELTRDEIARLENLTFFMWSHVCERHAGWIRVYLKNLTDVNKIIHGAVARSHS